MILLAEFNKCQNLKIGCLAFHEFEMNWSFNTDTTENYISFKTKHNILHHSF